MEPTRNDILEKAVRTMSTSMIIAGAAIALALYARPGPPRYQAVVRGSDIVRIDTKSGTIIGCNAGGCSVVLKRGQRLEGSKGHNFLLGHDDEEEAPLARLPAPKAVAPAAPAKEQ